MDPFTYLWIVCGIFALIGGAVAFMAHRQRLEDETDERRDIAAE